MLPLSRSNTPSPSASPRKQQQHYQLPWRPLSSHHGSFSAFDMVAAAAVAASFTSVLTALLAVHFLSRGYTESSSIMAVNQQMLLQQQQNHAFIHDLELFERPAQVPKLFADRLILPTHDSNDASRLQSNEGSDFGKIAWLMSFPNSGTSFTLHLTRESSNTTTATNYALEGEIKDKPSVPVLDRMSKTGPWLELIPNKPTNIPQKYILTKTHCSGFCNHCAPQRFLETPRSFQLSCQTGTRGDFHRAHSVNLTSPRVIKIPRSSVTYDAREVGSAIHVIRSPFDNIVARFHLDYNRQVRVFQNASYAESYPYNATGFHRWCDYYDHSQASQQPGSRWIDRRLLDKMKPVKCRQEFLQWIQWHNMAFASTREMNIPTLVLYYEDYNENLELARDRILNFLELPNTGGGIEFESGKSYMDYYSPAERKAVHELFVEYATSETWERVKHYFDEQL